MAAIEQIFDEIGGFHWFQLLMIVWVYSIKFMIAWSMMLMSFAGYKSDYICAVSGFFNQSALTYMNESQLWYEAETAVENATLLNVCEVNGTQCEDFHFFGTKRTAISEWDLLCDLRWMKATITSVQFGGVLTGSIIGGQSGDYFGRRKTLYLSYLIHTLFNVVAAYSVNWEMFIVMRFLIGAAIGVVLVMIVPYPTEFFPLKWRHTIPAVPMWPLGVLAFAGGAWLLEDWSHLQLACAVASIPGLLGYFYMPESARWLATRGKVEEAHDVLLKMARLNGKELPSHAMETIEKIARDGKMSRKGRDYSYHDIFKGATAKITLIVSFKWIVLSMVFYGLSFAVSSFAGDLYLNMFLMSVMEVPAYVISFFLIDRIGRKWTCLGFLMVSTLVSFACVGLHLKAPDSLRDELISACCLLAKLSVAACWAASMTWVTESYPTVTRSLGYGFANTSSRVGAIIAPFVINLDEMPLFTFILMGSLSLATMTLTFFIPETRNKVMAETVHDGEQGDVTENGDSHSDSEKKRNTEKSDENSIDKSIIPYPDGVALSTIMQPEHSISNGVDNYNGYTKTYEDYKF